MSDLAPDQYPPVVVFTYNRPAKLRRVLAALRNQGLPRLLVFVDGPRSDEDERNVKACQMLAQNVDWTETEVYCSEVNQGPGGFLAHISFVLNRYPAAVFLEDDCLPVAGFYEFMRQALMHYQDQKRVFSIGGYQHLPAEFFRGYPYTLVCGARFIGWGWATWRDRWREAWPFIQDYPSLFDHLAQVPEIAGRDVPILARQMAAGKAIDNWDLRVTLAALWLRKVHLLPVRGLVRNIGLDLSGLHRSLTNVLRALLLHNRNVGSCAPQEIIWPDDVTPNCDYITGLRDFVTRAQGINLRRKIQRGRVLFRRYIWPRREVLRDLTLPGMPRPARRALLSYIVYPFFIPEDDPRYFNHTNIWHARAIVEILNQLGYIVDVIDYRDRGPLPRRDYDLFIGHGGVNFESVCRQLPETTRKIFFTTGSYWEYHNQQERARFDALEQRRGVRLPLDRYIRHSEEMALQLADGVIALGNQVTRQTYAGFERVIMLNGTALYDDHLDWCPKDFSTSREHFLFYSGSGNVHKGLDLLLEAFSGLRQHLWISTRMDSGFVRLYSRELNDLPNIHLLGWVQPRSRSFYQMMHRCAFSLLPSCSEGQSQSIVETMNQGLIPIVSRESGLDVEGYGLYIEPCTIERIASMVEELCSWSPQQCQGYSQAARKAALSEFSEQAFKQRMRNAIQSFL